MKIKVVTKVLSLICLVVSFAMLPALFIAAYDGSNDAKSFIMSILAGIIICYLLYLYSGNSNINMGIREGVGITGFSWLIASLIGALPYWLSGAVPSYTDAFFETMSGFTTTGATIMTNIEILPRGIL